MDLHKLRVDQIGSLAPSASMREASDRHAQGEISAQELREVEDREIRAVIRRQEEVGLPVLTDGEFRRRNFQDSFGVAVSGLDTPKDAAKLKDWREPNNPLHRTEQNFDAAGPAILTRRGAVERLSLKRNLVLEEYKFAAAQTTRPVKVTLIGPDRISQRFAFERSQGVYKDVEEFIADVVKIERQMIKELVDAGCRYIQMDAPGFTAYVDEPSLQRMRARGEDPMKNLDRAIKAENDVIAGFDGVTFGLHVCRGNPRGVDASGKLQAQWHREGHYDAIAEKLFTGLNHQRLLLEYDSERAGSFDPLRFVRKDTVAVLGLVTTKTEDIEPLDMLMKRVEDASRHIPVDRMAVSPQCGFSSDIGLKPVKEEVQWRKFERLNELAKKVWG